MGPSVNRAKAYLVFAGMVQSSDIALQRLCQARLLSDLERDDVIVDAMGETAEQADAVYLAQCGALLVRQLVVKAGLLLSKLAAAITAIRGRKHPSAAQAKALKDASVAMAVVPLLCRSRVVLPLLDLELVVPDLLDLLQVALGLASGETTLDNAELEADEVITLPTSLLELMLAHPKVDSVLFASTSRLMPTAWIRLAQFAKVQSNLHPLPALQLLVALLYRAQSEQLWSELTAEQHEAILHELLPCLAAGLAGSNPVPAVAARLLLLLSTICPDASRYYAEYGVDVACFTTFQPQVESLGVSCHVRRRAVQCRNTYFTLQVNGAQLAELATLLPSERRLQEELALEGSPDSVPLATLTAAVVVGAGQDLAKACAQYRVHWRVAAALHTIDKVGVARQVILHVCTLLFAPERSA